MTTSAWAQFLLLIAALAVSIPVLGSYMAKVYGDERKAPGDRFFVPVERLAYRLVGVDPEAEQRWTVYALSLLAFSLVGVLVLYAILRLQQHLPGNPVGIHGMSAGLSFNTAASFLTNTDWQSYSGESAASQLTQFGALVTQNFASPAAGLCVAVAVVRGIVRHRSRTIGNFWVDLVRSLTRVLVPTACVFAIIFLAAGMQQNLHPDHVVTTLSGQHQVIVGGADASQESIKELGTNGGGPMNANSSHPYENPTSLTNFLEMWLLLVIPFSLAWMFGKMARDRRQGIALIAAMFMLWAGLGFVGMYAETHGNPSFSKAGVTQVSSSLYAGGGNLEGKEIRNGSPASALFADSATGTSTGAVDANHDSFTPLGGAVPLVNMMFGEVDPGGVGAGLYGVLIFALMTVFIAGLMVGRTPEYVGKKIQAGEMKLVVIYLLAVPLVALGFAAAAVLMHTALNSRANLGPHGLSEIVYAYVSASNNNGSAFPGLSGNTDWYDTTLGLCTLVGRFALMVPALAIAGSLARKQYMIPSAGTLPTGTPMFAGLLTGVVVVVVGLTFFPVLALGPFVEHFIGKF